MSYQRESNTHHKNGFGARGEVTRERHRLGNEARHAQSWDCGTAEGLNAVGRVLRQAGYRFRRDADKPYALFIEPLGWHVVEAFARALALAARWGGRTAQARVLAGWRHDTVAKLDAGDLVLVRWEASQAVERIVLMTADERRAAA